MIRWGRSHHRRSWAPTALELLMRRSHWPQVESRLPNLMKSKGLWSVRNPRTEGSLAWCVIECHSRFELIEQRISTYDLSSSNEKKKKDHTRTVLWQCDYIVSLRWPQVRCQGPRCPYGCSEFWCSLRDGKLTGCVSDPLWWKCSLSRPASSPRNVEWRKPSYLKLGEYWQISTVLEHNWVKPPTRHLKGSQLTSRNSVSKQAGIQKGQAWPRHK